MSASVATVTCPMCAAEHIDIGERPKSADRDACARCGSALPRAKLVACRRQIAPCEFAHLWDSTLAAFARRRAARYGDHLADDLVSTAFLACWTEASAGSLWAWRNGIAATLRTRVASKLSTAARGERRRAAALAVDIDLDDVVPANDNAGPLDADNLLDGLRRHLALRAAINALAPAHRELIEADLREEAVSPVGVSPEAIRQRRSRAVEALRVRLVPVYRDRQGAEPLPVAGARIDAEPKTPEGAESPPKPTMRPTGGGRGNGDDD